MHQLKMIVKPRIFIILLQELHCLVKRFFSYRFSPTCAERTSSADLASGLNYRPVNNCLLIHTFSGLNLAFVNYNSMVMHYKFWECSLTAYSNIKRSNPLFRSDWMVNALSEPCLILRHYISLIIVDRVKDVNEKWGYGIMCMAIKKIPSVCTNAHNLI